MRVGLAVVLASLNAVACDRDADPGAATAAASAAPSQATTVAVTSPSQAAPPGNAAAEDGNVYLALRGGGIWIGDEAGLREIQPTKQHALDFRRAQNGDVWWVGLDGTFRVAGAAVTRLPDASATWQALAATGPTAVWGLDYHALHRFDGTTWTDVSDGLPEQRNLKDVAVDERGRLWLATNSRVYVRGDDASWKKVLDLADVRPDAEPDVEAGQLYLVKFGVTPQGPTYLLSSEAVYRRRGDALEKLDVELSSPWIIACGSRGDAVVRDRLGVVVVQPDGSSRRLPEARLGIASAWGVNTDARGRLWVGTSHGLMIFAGTGERVVHYAPGTIAGMRDTVTSVVTIAGGPASLPTPGPPRLGGFRARLYHDGEPLEAQEVEICSAPRVRFEAGGTPCGHDPARRVVTSGANGLIDVAGVPWWTYSATTRVGDGWRTTNDLVAEPRGPDGFVDHGARAL